ncbi:CDP-glycerol glycerophosphotransferase family protein [Candidatus Sumerlaeota bacterium]|nr:CDP-glycerol glycerophosphotransferase family protein [Candidatus Sumerlaeota bacterium]
MSADSEFPPTILFCGKHRVNFTLFHPVYQLLRREPAIRLLLSSGRYRYQGLLGWWMPRDETKTNAHVFGEFDVDPNHLHRTSGRDTFPYAVCVTSNVDSKIIPRRARVQVQTFQGVSFRNYAVDRKYLRFDKLFFIGRYHIEQYVSRGLLREDDPRIELIGMPKLDRLVDGSTDRKAVLEGMGLDPGLPTVLWCPTGARQNSFEKWGRAALRAIDAAGVNTILKLHDHPHLPKRLTYDDLIAEARAGLGERGRLAHHSDVAPLLVAADLLVSDASSVAFEYCILDRPIVFIDVPELLAARASMEGSAMDLETHGRRIGRVVSRTEELTETIRAELAAPGALSPQRRAAAQHLFHDPGGAARRAADRLLALAREAHGA